MKASRAQGRILTAIETNIPDRLENQDKQIALLHRKMNKLLKILNTGEKKDPAPVLEEEKE